MAVQRALPMVPIPSGHTDAKSTTPLLAGFLPGRVLAQGISRRSGAERCHGASKRHPSGHRLGGSTRFKPGGNNGLDKLTILYTILIMRSRVLAGRFTEEEEKMVVKASAKEGMTVSEYIRTCVMIKHGLELDPMAWKIVGNNILKAIEGCLVVRKGNKQRG